MIVLDIWLPGLDGLTTLQRLRERQIDSQVVIISGHGNIESAVRAIKMGAYDFIEKPLSLEKTVLVVRNALRQRDLETENKVLRAKVDSQQPNTTMVGESPAMTHLREQVSLAAPTNGRVLILGENGTGKELVARTIHQSSRRKSGPFVEVNCAAIPEELIESELFGHVRGAFTGAVADKPGRFEQANAGTIFLDEIADMSLKTQAKVLRVLQEQVMERVGGTQRIKVDVRVLAATNKDLTAEIRAGRFREDLFFRLNVIPIFVPALRDRQQDIPMLAEHFMALVAQEHGRSPRRLASEAAARLQQYGWPGNVRELRNVIERVNIMVGGDTITAQDLGFLGRDGVMPDLPGASGPGGAALGSARSSSRRITSCERWRRSTATCREPRKYSAWSDRIFTRSSARSGSRLGVGPKLVLENLRAAEAFELQVELDRLPQRRRRHQPDNLALEHAHAVALGLALHQLEDPEDRRLLVVGEVHRYLDDAAILERDAHRLHVAQPAAAHPDRRRDLLCDIQPIGREVDVVGDQRHARADHRGAAARMRRRRAVVRRPSRLRQLRREPFELAAPDVFEILARRIRRRVFVQEDRQREALGHRLRQSTSPASRTPPS